MDCVIYARQGLASDLHSLHIMTQSYVWVVRKGRPLEKIAARDGFVMRDQDGRYPFILSFLLIVSSTGTPSFGNSLIY